ncbi:DUF6503 family protein [Gilvibacter sp. SZ-19]|uniref:DUF6503 family protein n=1 Tax=Gilvibacter sp. SZ-19 TaxID=754429 RepID=UPI0035117233
MLKRTTILLLCSLMLWSCNSGPTKEQQEPDPKAVKPRLTAGQIVDRAIEYHGGPLFEKSEIEFKFRDYQYRSLQEGGAFTLDRISYNDAIGKITDRVTNAGYTQVLNDEFEMNIVDSMKVKFTNSVNSVHYFARLPYGLNAPAVEKKLIGTDSIKGRAYHEVEVRFKQEGGGVDFQDVFMYWFDTETGAMDYLAYSYETDGGGIRFRAAYNPREINGLRFQDYVNYKPQGLDVALKDLDYLYEQGSLIEVSKIELENVKVKIVDDAL